MQVKVERVSEHIWSLSVRVLIPIRVWLVKEPKGVCLVDAGLPFMAKGILRAIDKLGIGPLTKILLTHGHGDHVGAIQGILKRVPVPVFAHRVEIPYMEGDKAYPRRKKARASLPKGLVASLPETPSGPPQDVAGLSPFLTPGHSPGHVVYFHKKDLVLIGGDLAMTRRGALCPPIAMFTSDMESAIRSMGILRQLEPARLEVCHADPIEQPAERFDAFMSGRQLSA